MKINSLLAFGTTLLLGSMLFPQLALAGTVNLKNCAGKPLWAKAFNSNDGLTLIPSAEGCVQPNATRNLSCATGSCKITIRYGVCEAFQPEMFGTYSGPVIYTAPAIGGAIRKGTTCPS